MPRIASGPSSAKAELAHLWCGCAIVSIIAVVLFSPGPLSSPDALGDRNVKTTRIAKKTGMAEWYYLSYWQVLLTHHSE